MPSTGALVGAILSLAATIAAIAKMWNDKEQARLKRYEKAEAAREELEAKRLQECETERNELRKYQLEMTAEVAELRGKISGVAELSESVIRVVKSQANELHNLQRQVRDERFDNAPTDKHEPANLDDL